MRGNTCGSIQITKVSKNCKEGELGINLAQFEPKEITGLKQVSGIGAKDALYAERGKYLNDTGIEQIGNHVASEIHGGESKDYIAGSYGADRLCGDGGNDAIARTLLPSNWCGGRGNELVPLLPLINNRPAQFPL